MPHFFAEPVFWVINESALKREDWSIKVFGMVWEDGDATFSVMGYHRPSRKSLEGKGKTLTEATTTFLRAASKHEADFSWNPYDPKAWTL